MTTEKALRKILETLQMYCDKNMNDYDIDDYKNTFASTFYPKLYKRNPQKAVIKAMVDLDICETRNYIKYEPDAETFEECITLTNEGAQRIETKADSFRSFFVKALIALAGAAGTVICSFIIQLIQSYL